MFEGPSAPAHFEKEDRQIGGRLAQLVSPDLMLSPAVAEIGFVHRSTGSEEIYFLANTANVYQS